MKTVYKYEITPDSRSTLHIPQESEILKVDSMSEKDKIFIWVEVDTTLPNKEIEFVSVGTGVMIPDDYNSYVGTCQTVNGHVHHVYRKTMSMETSKFYINGVKSAAKMNPDKRNKAVMSALECSEKEAQEVYESFLHPGRKSYEIVNNSYLHEIGQYFFIDHKK